MMRDEDSVLAFFALFVMAVIVSVGMWIGIGIAEHDTMKANGYINLDGDIYKNKAGRVVRLNDDKLIIITEAEAK